MSWQASHWAVRQVTGSATAKAVLVILAEAADDDGFTFVGQATVAERAEITRRAVLASMKTLEGLGLIDRQPRRDTRGHRTSDAITLSLAAKNDDNLSGFSAPQGEGGSPRAKVKEVHSGRAQCEPDAHPYVNVTTLQGEGGSQYLVSEPSGETRGVKPSRRKPETTIPEGFPGAADIEAGVALVKQLGGSVDVRHEAGKFRDHALEKDRRCRAWAPAWNNWLRNAVSYAAQRGGGSSEQFAHLKAERTPPANIWESRLRSWRSPSRYWNTTDWGPAPGKPGCMVPPQLLIADAAAIEGAA